MIEGSLSEASTSELATAQLGRKTLPGQLMPLESLPISTAEAVLARSRSLRRWQDVDLTGAVADYVIRHAMTRPDAVAVRSADREVTYRELSTRTGVIRSVLIDVGCGPGEIVAAIGTRGSDTLALFLALESLGAAYLPLAPGWPTKRLLTILQRSRAPRLVVYGGAGAIRSWGRLLDQLPDERRPPVLTLEGERHGRRGTLPALTHRSIGTEIRYLIYTSGTTGSPKGAAVAHHGMMNHLWSKVIDLELDAGDVVAFTAPLTFDIAIWQMLAPLLVGGTVTVLTDQEMRYPRRLCAALRRSGATVAEFVPTVVGWLVDGLRSGGPLPDLRWLISTGEELPPATAKNVLAAMPDMRLMNAYGPTECSDDVTHHVVGTEDLARPRIPVGGPIINVALYVLTHEDGQWGAAAEGDAGELFVGGVPVGLGYPDDTLATKSVFFQDVLDPDSPTGRLYRTGDAAKVQDGVIHYLGRLDRQVKIAGVRVELGGIEAAVSLHPAIRQCAVVAVAGGGGKELAIYYVPANVTCDVAAVAGHLGDHLPAAMIPRRWRAVDALPLTGNGKIDYSALRRAQSHAYQEQWVTTEPGEGSGT